MIERAVSRSTRSGASTRPATTHASSDAIRKTPSAIPAATRRSLLTWSISLERSLVTTKAPPGAPSTRTGTDR